MFGTQNIAGKCVLAGGLAFAVFGASDAGATPQFTTLYTFTGGNDGGNPDSNLIKDSAGNLYGETALGGTGHGVVFELAPSGTETVLHAFAGGANGDGSVPQDGLTRLHNGTLLGVTLMGGTAKEGAVFELAPDGTESLIHSFTGGSDGASPSSGLTKVGKDLYGETQDGGPGGAGIVFKLSNKKGVYTESTVYAFTGGNDGGYPGGGLTADAAGNLYGTTPEGGSSTTNCSPNYGCGAVFKIAADGTETVLYAFTGGSDGSSPQTKPLLDSSGNLYGTTGAGGEQNTGTIFKLAPDGTETVLHSFPGENGDGSSPDCGLISDKKGNLYGTTAGGGANNRGIVYELAADGTYTILHTFGDEGAIPEGPLLLRNGTLYSIANSGGADNYGIAFSLTTK